MTIDLFIMNIKIVWFTLNIIISESVAFEWSTNPGLIRYYYHNDRRPDTRADILSFGLLTALSDCVLFRVDSATSSDFLQVQLVKGNVWAKYNLGKSDIAIGEVKVKVNDGKYHVIRFTRSGANSTLQIDDNQIQEKLTIGRQLTVFNSQSQIEIGGVWNPEMSRLEKPLTGVIAGLVYNGLRPLDAAADKDKRAKVQGDVRLLSNIPFDYRERNPKLFGMKDEDYMQRTNPSFRPEPGINDDLIYGRSRCTGDDEMYYNSKCFEFDGSGETTIQ